MRGPKRILFFAEAVTLAHLARPLALAKCLDASRYEVILACDSRYRRFFEREPWQTLPLHSISSKQFLHALASGSPVYDAATLREYIKQDLELIEHVVPDLIVGDFRLSLSVSARLAGVPYATITNAYWSPCYFIDKYPIPALPLTRFLPLTIAKRIFDWAQPFAFAMHCRPLNTVRQENGFSSMINDLRQVYTDADHVLYADSPAIFPIQDLPSNHRYLGSILWSPAASLPDWWDDLPCDKPIIYVTLGSSGPPHLLQVVLNSLANQPVTVIASMAGTATPPTRPTNAYLADYLPGMQAALRSRLVICNGGSPTSQQALAAGVPVLGIASNMDQFLNMTPIVSAGAGQLLRGDRIRGSDVVAAVMQLLADTEFTGSACRLAKSFATLNASAEFSAFVSEVIA